MNICPRCGSSLTGAFCQDCGYHIAQTPQQPYQYPTLGPLPKKGKFAIVMAIISLVMLLITGAIGWWSMSIEYEREDSGDIRITEYKMDFGLSDVSYESDITRDGETESYDDDADLIGNLEEVGETTSLLFILGIVMTIIVMILTGILMAIVISRNVELNMFSYIFKYLTLLFAFLAVIFILVAPIYYMIVWPMTMEDQLDSPLTIAGEEIYDGSFMGSNSFDYEEMGDNYSGESSWGPSLGWFLAFVCLVLLIITLVLVKSAGDEAMRLRPMGPQIPLQQVEAAQTPRPPPPRRSKLPPPPPPRKSR
jgi:cytochrome b subunit of formate dehydrogenase